MNATMTDEPQSSTAEIPSETSLPRAAKKSRVRGVVGVCWRAIRATWGWIPVTGLSVLAVPILGVILEYYGRQHRDKIALALTAGGLFLIAVAVATIFLTAVWMRLWLWIGRRRSDELRCEAGTPFRTGFTLGRVHWNPLVKVDLVWESPTDVEVRTVSQWGRLDEEITASDRAWQGEVVRRVTVSDVFGLARVTFRLRTSQLVRIMPNRGRLDHLEIRDQFTSGEGMGHPAGKPEGDLVETRRYGAGDPLKMVLWKLYARTGRMLVRMPERSVSVSDKVLAYMVAGAADNAAAELARGVLDTGKLGNNFLFGADGTEAIAQNSSDALELVAQSVNARSAGGEGLSLFLEKGETKGVQACLLFVPATRGGWLNNVTAALRRFNGPFHVIIGASEGDAIAPEGRWRRWLMKSRPGSRSAAEFRRIVDCLLEAGARVSVVDPKSGTMVSV